MEILIGFTSITDINGNLTKGYTVSMTNKSGKRNTQDSDVFLDGSEIEIKITQLKKLLKTYFDAQV
jgi:hypothetical protein